MFRESPPITDGSFGRAFVALMADGIEAFMREQNIPFNDAGYERVLQISRETGRLGMIAFESEVMRGRLRALLSEYLGAYSRLIMTDFDRVPSGTEVAKRLHDVGLTIDDDGRPSAVAERFLSRIASEIHPEARVFFEAFMAGDCQRRHVFDVLRARHLQT